MLVTRCGWLHITSCRCCPQKQHGLIGLLSGIIRMFSLVPFKAYAVAVLCQTLKNNIYLALQAWLPSETKLWSVLGVLSCNALCGSCFSGTHMYMYPCCPPPHTTHSTYLPVHPLLCFFLHISCCLLHQGSSPWSQATRAHMCTPLALTCCQGSATPQWERCNL